MDKKLIFAGAFGLLFLGVLVWFLFFRKNPVSGKSPLDFSKKDDKPATQPTKTVTNTVYVNSGGGGNARNDNFPLKQGSYGEKVKQIQAKLKITADGDWGPGTQAALVKAGITSGFADQAALDKWLNPANTTTNTNINVAGTSGGYQKIDNNYRGKWGFSEPISVYEDVQPKSKYESSSRGETITTVFQPATPIANNAFYGLGIVKDGYLKVQHSGRGIYAKYGWVLLSKLTKVAEVGWTDPFDGENEETQRKRNTRKRY